jgi:hypothetical protein
VYCKQFVVGTKKTSALDYDSQKRFVVTTKEFYDAWKQLLLQPRKLLLWNMMFESNCCCNQENFCFGIRCSEEIAVATKKTLLWNMVFRRNGCCNQENFCFGIWCSEEIAVATK